MTIPEEIEHLKNKLTHIQDEKEEADLLMELLKKYASINSTDSKAYIDRLLQSVKKTGSTRYQAWGLLYLAIYNRLKGEYDDAMNIALSAIALFEQDGDMDGLARICLSIGSIHWHRGDYPEAMKSYTRALQIGEAKGNQQVIASSYNNIGAIYREQGNYSEALKNYTRAHQIREETGDKAGMAGSYNNIAEVYEMQGKYPEALKHYSRVLQIKEDIGDKN